MPLDVALLRQVGRTLPRQNFALAELIHERHRLAVDAHEKWAIPAKQCVEYYEGNQWSEIDAQKLWEERRPKLTINMVKPLVNLVAGYHINNRTVDRYLPGNDGTGSAEMAHVLTQVSRQIDEMNDMPWVDYQVFMDGIQTGRGYYSATMDFTDNIYGSVKIGPVDPFTVFLDPDGDASDLNKIPYHHVVRWLSCDEIRHLYGPEAAQMVENLQAGSYSSKGGLNWGEEISPDRGFGGEQSWLWRGTNYSSWIDRTRRSYRVVDAQHWVMTQRWFFVDLKSGDQKPVPDSWGPERIERVMLFAKEKSLRIVLQKKAARRLRWTHQIADMLVYDKWAPDDTITLTPYFPYFRRGTTRGMIDDMISPQQEINVRRSSVQNHVMRTANSGWKAAEGSLTPEMEENLEKSGGRAGFILKYKTEGPGGTTLPQPEQISPAAFPVAIGELGSMAVKDIKEIAGINPAALGQIDKSNVSGLAVKAQQQQTVVGLEGPMFNFHLAKKQLGKKKLELIQKHYTEERIIRVVGENGNPIQVEINRQTANGIINDTSLGTYQVTVSEQTLTASFKAGEFNELTLMKQMGMLIPDEFFIDASSVGRKEELRTAMAAQREAMAAAGVPAGDAAGQGGTGPGGSRVGLDGGSLPNRQEG